MAIAAMSNVTHIEKREVQRECHRRWESSYFEEDSVYGSSQIR